MIFVKVRMMKTMKTATRYRRNHKNVYTVLRDFLKETWCKFKRDTSEVAISISYDTSVLGFIQCIASF